MSKHCPKCGCETERTSDGTCRPCKINYGRQYRIDNKAQLAEKKAGKRIANASTIREYQREYYEKNKERAAVKNKQYRLENAEAIREQRRKHRTENKERIAARKASAYRANIDTERAKRAGFRAANPDKIKEWSRKHYVNNPATVSRNRLERRARQRNQCPKWANAEAIKLIYGEAAALRDAGIDVEVDHVIPLRGELVSGLHCEFNLQILTKHQNRSKQNTFNPVVHG